MGRIPPKPSTIRALFAKSGNQCAFPDCHHPLINEKNQFVAQVCHIEAAEKGGERYNPLQNDDERRSYDNLLLMCYRHHIETNDIEEFSVERLKEIKYNHENRFAETPYKVNSEIVLKIVREFERYWSDIQFLHDNLHNVEPVKMEIDFKASFFDKIDQLKEHFDWIIETLDDYSRSDEKLTEEIKSFLEMHNQKTKWIEKISYIDNPFENRNWELHNLGVPNFIQLVEIAICQIEIEYLKQFLQIHPEDKTAIQRMRLRMEEFKYYAQNSGYFD